MTETLEQVSDEEILVSLKRLEDLRKSRWTERELLYDARRKVDNVLTRINKREGYRLN